MTELEAKIRIFEAIAKNSQDMCERGFYYTPSQVAETTNRVYNILNNG